jgi:hypothetical protein
VALWLVIDPCVNFGRVYCDFLVYTFYSSIFWDTRRWIKSKSTIRSIRNILLLAWIGTAEIWSIPGDSYVFNINFNLDSVAHNRHSNLSRSDRGSITILTELPMLPKKRYDFLSVQGFESRLPWSVRSHCPGPAYFISCFYYHTFGGHYITCRQCHSHLRSSPILHVGITDGRKLK